MVDKARLQLVGWVFGGATAIVMLIAALLVGEAVASNRQAPKPEQPAKTMVAMVQLR